MNRYSIVDQSSPTLPRPAVPKAGNPALPHSGDDSVRFPGEDGGKSLAETARGDVDAALQLLVERAKYITGALASTIALYQDGELVCHACTGAPRQKLGTRLLVGSGLAAESVRTRRILRSNDTSNDERTNPEICRKYGIASAMVMPLVRGPEVIGVFELLSGTTQAFEERDISALARLGEMVETAMEHAEAAKEPPSTTFFEEELPEPEVEIVPLELDSESQSSTAVAVKPAKSAQHAEAPILERGTIGNCQACGFPVSGKRRLCVDCTAANPVEAVASPEASAAPAFIVSHVEVKPAKRSTGSAGYIVATFFLSLATAAMVIWVRFPELANRILIYVEHFKIPHLR